MPRRRLAPPPATRRAAARLAGRAAGARRRRATGIARLLARVLPGSRPSPSTTASTSATLTGFKWISRAPGIVFGFEEALGYLVNPETVRDKDGISAAVAMLGMIAEARERGTTLADCSPVRGDVRLLPVGQVSLRVEDLSIIGRIMAALAPIRRPRSAPSRSSASTTCSRASRATRPATCCACGSPTGRA
jgi:hypothetical protein